MKNIYLFLMITGCLFLTSYKSGESLPPGRTYNLFYVDNSYSEKYENFTQDMFSLLDSKLDSIRDDRFSQIGFFVSDGVRTNFASNYNGAKSFVSRLSNGNTSAPNSFYDRGFIVDNLLTVDISNIRRINVNFFLTEGALLSDFLSGSNAGLLINSLPREIQFLTDCKEENITVTIYYPASSKKVDEKMLKSFTDFSEIQADFASKIKFEFQPI